MIKNLFVTLPRLSKASSAFKAFNQRLPQQFHALAFRPNYYCSDSSKHQNAGENYTAKIDLEKMLNENIDINVQDKTIRTKDGKEYKCKFYFL